MSDIKLKIEQSLARGKDMLFEHGLHGWVVTTNRKRSCIAETYHSNRVISYSKYFLLQASEEQFVGITLHEIAHAILGPGVGHGDKFTDLCTRISPTPVYACEAVDIPIRRYIMSCPSCGYSGNHNENKTLYCAKCFGNGDMVEFDVRENKLELVTW